MKKSTTIRFDGRIGICECKHEQERHDVNLRNEKGNGACQVKGCRCTHFIWWQWKKGAGR